MSFANNDFLPNNNIEMPTPRPQPNTDTQININVTASQDQLDYIIQKIIEELNKPNKR